MDKRARRRDDMYRMKQRAYRLLKYWKHSSIEITPRMIGRTAAMHGTHQCKMCNFHKHDGSNARPFSEHRRGIPDDHE